MTPEEANQRYVALRQQRDARQIPDAQFRQLVAQLAVAGADGSAWQLDADTGQWVVSQPPQPAPPATQAAPANRWWSILLMMVSPGQVLARGLGKISWPFALSVSGAAFTLFFFETGLDRWHVKSLNAGGCAQLALLGAVYGTLGIAAVGLVAWALSKFIGGDQPPGWVIRAIALSYSSGLVYGAVGLVFNLFFKWNTSLAFGVTGVLWALGPMMAVFRQISKGKIAGSVVLATICGALVLLGWGALATGNVGR
jgi:hypothetical protein